MRNNDLISRSALLRTKTRMTEYDESGCGMHVYVVRVDDIENTPAVDAVEVVRCARCKHLGLMFTGEKCCMIKQLNPIYADSYCSYGETENR